MASVDLTDIRIRAGEPEFHDHGGLQEPFAGGVIQKLDRLGSRYSIGCELPPLKADPDGRQWVSRLTRAKLSGGILAFPQLDLAIGSPGSPVVDGAVSAQSTSLPLRGLTPHYAIREGQFLSVVSGAYRHLLSADAQAIADASGNVTVTVKPMTRFAFADGDVVEIAQPKIEGWIQGDGLPWSIDVARTVGLSFRIIEKK